MEQKMEVIYEDEQILICYKPAGLATQTSSIVQEDMVSQVKNYRKGKGEDPYVGVVHRLDQPVEGLLAFAKTPRAADLLGKQLQRHQMQKCYLAIINRSSFPSRGVLEDYMVKDAMTGRARVVDEHDPRAKIARLSYEVIEECGAEKLLDIRLQTGRFHQIRAQLAAGNAPIVGDAKYGGTATGRPLCLCAYRLIFRHPATGEEVEFAIRPRGEDFRDFTSLPRLIPMKPDTRR